MANTLDDVADLAGRRWIPIADADSFAALEGQYAMDNGNIYFADGSNWDIVNSPLHWKIKVPAIVDRDSFKIVGDEFALDRTHVYWCCDVLVNVAPRPSLRSASPSPALETQSCTFTQEFTSRSSMTMETTRASSRSRSKGGPQFGSSQDERRGVLSGEAIEGADASTFEHLGTSRFCRDSSRVYFEGYGGDDEWLTVVEGANAASFEILGSTDYARDRDRVYSTSYGEEHCFLDVIEGALPATFVVPDEDAQS